MKASENFADGLDVCCGDMGVKPLFRTRTYTGVDNDAPRLARAAAKNPDARAVVQSIEDLNLTGDFVVCVQMLGAKWIAMDRVDHAIGKLIEATRPGGTLLFNHKDENRARYPEITARLRQFFSSVLVREYAGESEPVEYAESIRIAKEMYDNPEIRGVGRAYFVCKARLAE
jgi:hypothetical protein